MSTYSGEVVPTPGEEKPFKVVIRGPDGVIIDERPVDSQADGEAMLTGILRGLDDGEVKVTTLLGPRSTAPRGSLTGVIRLEGRHATRVLAYL